MGAVPGRVNRSAGSSSHDDFRLGNRFDQEPGSRAKASEFSAGKNDIFAASIRSDPDAARLTEDSASLWKVRALHHPFGKVM